MKHIWGRKFTIFTDHSALVYLFTKLDPSAMESRWIDLLMALDFNVVHWPGDQNDIADALSRPSCINNIEMAEETGLMKGKSVPVVERRRDMIQQAHLMGHFGLQQVFLKIWHDGFWWPKIREEIAETLGSCDACLRYNILQQGFHPLGLVTALRPADHGAMDLMELPVADSGHKYVFVYMDIATRFAVLTALTNKEAATVAKAFYDVGTLLGFPKIIQSDNGKEFVNKILKTIAKVQGVDHRLIASYHPQANGAVERANKDVKGMLKKVIKGDWGKWPQHLAHIQYCFNTHINRRTDSTPFALMFGRSPLKWNDYTTGPPDQKFNVDGWRKELRRLNSVVYDAIQAKVQKKHKKAIKDHAKNSLIRDELKPGETVYAINVTRKGKTDDSYEGPFTVVRRNTGGAYILRNGAGEEVPYRFPINHLKLAKQMVVQRSYEVLRIKRHRGEGPFLEYLVQWMDPAIMDSWLTPDLFDGTREIKAYHDRIKVRPPLKIRLRLPKPGQDLPEEDVVNTTLSPEG